MKYCSQCGGEINDDAVVCIHCGRSVENAASAKAQKDSALDTLIKVFMIIGCVSLGWSLVPLAWCIPMTVSVFKKINSGEPISTGFKVCTLLFVNVVAGICMLCRNDDQ